ncbi:transglycosylase SLT domain-containing protein [Methylomonas sp. MgM2]
MGFVIRLLLFINLLTISLCHAATSERALSAMRQSFLQAEDYIKQNRDDDYLALSDTLKDYPLYPYLHYQWLLTRLNDDTAILAFLYEYPNTRYAPLLHGKWLARLGENQQWLTFIQHYKSTSNQELQCYFAQAQYQLGQQHLSLQKAKELWSSGKSQANSCDVLFDWLKASAEFNSELVWQRFLAALKFNNSELARQTLALLPKTEQKMAQTWLKLHDRPRLVKAPARWKRTYTGAGLLFAHSIKRWLDRDPDAAMKVWDAEKGRFSIPEEIVADTEKRLGMELAFRQDKRAYPRLVKFAGDDPPAQEWRVRAALSQLNWHDVLSAVELLRDDLKQLEKWRYWRARALVAVGKTDDAHTILSELAKQRSFYGFLSADYLKQEIELNNRPIDFSTKQLSSLKNRDEFLAVSELLAIDRRPEATRQWWHAIAGLDKQELPLAAKMAQQWQWPSMAIFTIAKANHWDDVDLRFPLVYQTLVFDYAGRQQLDPALIFGLIRQESAFDEFAGSPAGAIGLMQLMPKTAQQMADELKDPWTNDYNLLNPAFNIKYGSAYFKKLLDQFKGRFAPSIAAYNAGPNRVRHWLPQNQALPADIWIETIPYKETRNYVSSVIAYTLIYQKRLSGNALKISDLLTEISSN